jgi:hypothetical protein
VATFDLSSTLLRVAGAYTYTASMAGASDRTAPETVIAASAHSIAATGGSVQSAAIGAAFATALTVTVKDSYGNLVSGATVIFTPPASGASATLTTPAPTDANGQTSVTATANGTVGSYTVTAAIAGTSASFLLTNTAIAPTLSISCYSGAYTAAAHGCAGTATGVGGVTVSGTWIFNPGSETAANSYSETGTFTSTNSSYSSGGTASNTLTIAPAPLTVTANNTSMTMGAAVPALTYTTTGFAGTDTSSVVGGIATETTTASSSSSAGTYPITFSTKALTAANYTFSYVNGTLSVVQAPTVSLAASSAISGSASAGYTVTITIKNTGNGPASNVTLATVTLGSASGSPLPQTLGTVAAGASGTLTVHFPGSVGADGAAVAEKYTGTYTGGTFAASVRAVTLP